MDSHETETNRRKGSDPFKPYARLISILGDQLISSKWVGVIELVKNCYDADAENVWVRFIGFDEPDGNPVIEIEDNGDGMTKHIIRNVWLKPATPHKLNQKKSDTKRFTKKGRVMQGDKGVGRFAIYKLGNFVEVFTKTESTDEMQLTLNFREYAQNDEFAEKNEVPEKFLDQIKNDWQENEIPIQIINEKGKGTLIRISDLRNDWKYEDLERLQIAFQRMIPPIIPGFEHKINRDFNVDIHWNGVKYPPSSITFEKVIPIAPFSFNGTVEENGVVEFTYSHNNKKQNSSLDLFDSKQVIAHDVWKLPMFKEQFLEYIEIKKDKKQLKIKKLSGEDITQKSYWKVKRKPNVGKFSFYFYAFDWRKMELTEKEKAFIKDNSVYLYRDFTRVYPYGERGIDWLLLSKLRSEDRAGHYFSYNDLCGFVFITQKENPDLRDAASREGLVNRNGVSDDFVALIQASLKIMKDFVDVDKRREETKKEKAFVSINQKFTQTYVALQHELEKINDKKILDKAKSFFNTTLQITSEYKNKMQITEDLAGLGMAVEKSTHDLFMLINKIRHNTEDMSSKFEKGKISATNLRLFFQDLNQTLDFLYEELQILQPLFRESRKTIKDISVRETFERIERYYRREFQFNINFKIEGSKDIVVKANLGLLLQVFINLIDNSIYWLSQKSSGNRKILVKIDSARNRVIVSDNGIGIKDDLAEVIFLEFYSTKAGSGRGLGLYIAKELLERINANISLITTDEFKILPGANFLIQFDEDKIWTE
ncbi:MAG: ATP-binding protein [Pyrinomonadaceae bacterium]|nr:ATP-binding protein [Pyrinomonadaceae bacterium]